MKIIIDMTNSPHVPFFMPIIKELRKRNHEVKIIAREHAQTTQLLDLYRQKYVVIGKHAGRSLWKKVFSAFGRVNEVRKYIRKENPDICVSHQSPYIVYASFLSGKRSIYIFDNERARLQNALTFPLATRVICPESVEVSGKKFVKYPGVKEAIYLKDYKPNMKNIEQLSGFNGKRILIRTEIKTAAYHEGESLSDLAKNLADSGFKVIISSRTNEEAEMYKNYKNKNIRVIEKPIDGPTLIKNVDLVISGGGTMNREAAVLGVPVISVYSGKLLSVDKYLIEKGLMVHNLSPSVKLIKDIMKKKVKRYDLGTGKRAIKLIVEQIENLK